MIFQLEPVCRGVSHMVARIVETDAFMHTYIQQCAHAHTFLHTQKGVSGQSKKKAKRGFQQKK